MVEIPKSKDNIFVRGIKALRKTNPSMAANPGAHAPLAVAISLIDAIKAKATKKKKGK